MKYERLLLTAAACLLTPQFPALAQCTQTTDCGALGYTETSCPDGGIKCPFGDKWACGAKKCTTYGVKDCEIGDVLYSDKKCYTCLPNALPDPVPIGVVFSSGKAVGLIDLSTGDVRDNTDRLCRNHTPGGVSGWSLPTKDELVQMHNNINAVQTGLQSAVGGSKLASKYYWSSSYHTAHVRYYHVFNPVSGDADNLSSKNTYSYVRPVLAF